MRKFVLALAVLLLASSSASAWPRIVAYGPVAAYPVPVTAYYGAPVVSYYGQPVTTYYAPPAVVSYGVPYYGYAYRYPFYIPGQPVRNALRAAAW